MPAIPIISAIAVGSGAAAALGTAVAGIVGATVTGAAAVAIGSGVIAAGATAIQGGSASDILKSAVLGGVGSFVGASVAASVSSSIASAATSAGMGSIASTLGQVAGSMAAGGTQAALGAAVSGKDPIEALIKGGLTAGLTSGVMAGVSGLTSKIPGFDSLDDDYGEFGAAAQRAVKSTLAAGVLGKDVDDALKNSVLDSITGTLGKYADKGIKDLGLTLKSTYADATGIAEDLQANIDRQNQLVEDYNSTAEGIEAKRLALKSDLDKYNEYKSKYENYDTVMQRDGYQASYDDWGNITYFKSTVQPAQWLTDSEGNPYWGQPTRSQQAPSRDEFLGEANRYAKLVNDAVPAYEKEVAAVKTKLDTIKADLDRTNAEYAPLEEEFLEKKALLQETVTDFQEQEEQNAQIIKDIFESTVEAKENIESIFGKELSQEQLDAIVETGDPLKAAEAFIKSIDGADEETRQLAFEKLSDGVDTAAAFAVDQRETTIDEAREIMLALGYSNPTDDEVKQFAGQSSESTSKKAAQDYINNHTVSEDEARQYLTSLGYEPTDEEIKQFAKQGADVVQKDVESDLGKYVADRTIDREEAEKFFRDLDYTPSEEELQQFMRQGADVNEQDVIGEVNEYVDANTISEDEAREIYEQLGLKSVAQEDIDKLLGQYSEEEAAALAEENLDTARYNSLYEQLQGESEDGANTEELQALLDEQGEEFTEQLGGVQDDVDALADELGLTKDELLEELGLTEEELSAQIEAQGEEFTEQLAEQGEELGEQIGGVQSNVDALADELGLTKEELLGQLGETEEELSAQISQQGTIFTNLFKNWGKYYQQQSAAQEKARQAQLAAQAKAQQTQLAAQAKAQQTQTATVQSELENQLQKQQQRADYNNLLNMLMMSGMAGGQQAAPQQPVQNPLAEVKSFEEQGFGDLFGDELKFAKGGEINELLRILRG